MSEINTYLTQYILRNGTVKCEDVNILIKNISDKLNNDQVEQNASRIISKINQHISQQSFRIDQRICEQTGEKVFVYVNTCLEDGHLTLTDHSAAELELFNAVLTNIIMSDSKCFSTIMCLNLCSRLKNHISKDTAQINIDRWIGNGYLVKVDGMLHFGPRTLAEFQPYFQTHFQPQITTCPLCTDTVYYGKICAECNSVIHLHCLVRHQQNNTTKCPACKQQWNEKQSNIMC